MEETGIQVASSKLKENTYSVPLTISHLKPGLYLVVFESDGMTVARKLSVIR